MAVHYISLFPSELIRLSFPFSSILASIAVPELFQCPFLDALGPVRRIHYVEIVSWGSWSRSVVRKCYAAVESGAVAVAAVIGGVDDEDDAVVDVAGAAAPWQIQSMYLELQDGWVVVVGN